MSKVKLFLFIMSLLGKMDIFVQRAILLQTALFVRSDLLMQSFNVQNAV